LFAEFDELSYLELNPDVEAAVLAGSISSGREHWTKYGRQEGRLTTRPKRPEGAPPEWNEFNYLRANPDVAAAARNRVFSSGYEHWVAYGRHEARSGGPEPFKKTSAVDVLKKVPAGFNSFGYEDASTGLGSAIRGFGDIFRSLTSNVKQIRVPVWGADRGPVSKLKAEHIPYAFNFIHQNPDVLPHFLYHFGSEILDHRINIGHWVWEMHAGYPTWHRLSRLFHEIWVPSSYVASSLQGVSLSSLATIPYVVDGLPASPSLTRSSLGLPEDAFIFLYVFDIASTIGRKNPLAVLRSFRNVFHNNKNAVLLLKYHNSYSDPAGVGALERLASSHANVRLLNKTLASDDVYSLFQITDCFVSPHRSEGFGLNIATAMYYGQPVIATGYSGNMDYMNASNAFPIEYEVVQAGPGHHNYRDGYGWAEPSPQHLEALLLRVYENRELAARTGAAGKKSVREQFNVDTVAQQVRNRLQTITDGLLSGNLS